MLNETQDITELLFPLGEISEQQKMDWELWGRASEEAFQSISTKSPMELLRKTEEIYLGYLGGDKQLYKI